MVSRTGRFFSVIFLMSLCACGGGGAGNGSVNTLCTASELIVPSQFFINGQPVNTYNGDTYHAVAQVSLNQSVTIGLGVTSPAPQNLCTGNLLDNGMWTIPTGLPGGPTSNAACLNETFTTAGTYVFTADPNPDPNNYCSTSHPPVTLTITAQ